MNILKASLFALSMTLASTTFAATGTGEAQAELTNPLSIVQTQALNFGSVAIDPGAGPQTLVVDRYGMIQCPAAYVCSSSVSSGVLQINGAPSTPVNYSLVGQTAVLSDGAGHTLVFDPSLDSYEDTRTGRVLGGDGKVTVIIIGTIDFTGDEIAGTYNTTNAGGSGYQITVNY